jgi:hypothetical protein
MVLRALAYLYDDRRPNFNVLAFGFAARPRPDHFSWTSTKERRERLDQALHMRSSCPMKANDARRAPSRQRALLLAYHYTTPRVRLGAKAPLPRQGLFA